MESSAIWKIVFFISILIFSGKSNAITCKSNPSLIKSGDLIYRYQDSIISNLVLHYQQDSSYSHVGIAVKEDNQIKVFHSVLEMDKNIDGVTISSYCDYVNDAVRIEVKRLKNDSLELRNRIVRSVNLIGARKFNRTFNLNFNDVVYCTQYIWLVYKDALGVDLFHVNRQNLKVITVKKLFNSNYFYTVFKQEN